MNAKTLLFDIEGTTTDINFVHHVLFPYSFERLESFTREHSSLPEVDEVRALLAQELGIQASLSDVIAALKRWVRTDRKIAPLKSLQGKIWQEGYLLGVFRGHVYPDVPTAWRSWQKAGYQLAIYSSGSVEAQQLLFRHSIFGDLTPLITGYFDTKVGAKREISSYAQIAQLLKRVPSDITFFSDIEAELDAARGAGMQTWHVFRDQLAPSGHKRIRDFDHLPL